MLERYMLYAMALSARLSVRHNGVLQKDATRFSNNICSRKTASSFIKPTLLPKRIRGAAVTKAAYATVRYSGEN